MNMNENVGLIRRHAECAALDQLLRGVRAGESRALVLHVNRGTAYSMLDAMGNAGIRLTGRG
jgi:hypothetical protein